MILLSGHSLTPARRVPVEALSLSLKERDSTAEMTPAIMTGISTESWFLDDTAPGNGIVWRVRSIQTSYDTDTPVIQLEHAISTLRDRILFGEITPETIAGEGATSCSAYAAVQFVLAQQSDWVLGSFGFSDSAPYKFDGDTLYDALEKVSKSLSNAWWSYDMSQYPFVLNITARPSGVSCEMRPGRNLSTLSKTVDKTGMYTRFYPIGKDDLHISGNYVSRNESLYGVISAVGVDQSLETEGELIAWANQQLDRHAEPAVNITANGLDLAQATGETLDRLTLGRICRIPLTEFGTTIEERIVELNYRDKAHAPEEVQITLANSQEDITRIIADAIKSGYGGSGGRGAARQDKEDHAWFEDTDTHVAMVAEGIVGIDPETGEPDWARLSQIIVDGEGVHQMVTVMHEDLVEAQASIEINENAIASEVLRASSEEGVLRSEILQTATMIYSSVEANNSQIYSEVIQTANEIRSQVSNALSDFYTAIIQTASEIIIRTGDNTKTFHQRTAPTGTADEPLVDGDLWFNGLGQFTWGDAAGKTWLEDTEYNWGEVKTNSIKRYDGISQQWVPVSDEYALLQDTRFEQAKDGLRMVAGRVDEVRGETQAHFARLEVEADHIQSSVADSHRQLSSSIRATAEQLTSDYVDRIAGTESHITQTASEIRLEVRNTSSEMYSMIRQNADAITLRVAKGEIISEINQTAEQVQISAGKIDLSGYVTASQLQSTNATINNLMTGYSTATEIKSANLRCNNFYFGGTRIYSSYQVQTTNGNTIYVLGHA